MREVDDGEDGHNPVLSAIKMIWRESGERIPGVENGSCSFSRSSSCCFHGPRSVHASSRAAQLGAGTAGSGQLMAITPGMTTTTALHGPFLACT